jgi:hypothetical protein
MTVSKIYAPLSFECTSKTNRFQISWRFMADRDLIVHQIPKDGERKLLTIAKHYTVEDDRVVLSEAPPVGDVVLVERKTQPIQPYDLTDQSTEEALDRILLIVQENVARGEAQDGLSLAIHQADIDRAVEAYLNDIGPELVKGIHNLVKEDLPQPERSTESQPITFVGPASTTTEYAPQEVERYLVEIVNEITELKKRLGDVDQTLSDHRQIIDQQTEIIRNLELNNQIAFQAVAVVEDEHPNIVKYPIFAKALGLTETSSQSDWANALSEFRRRA